MKKCTKCKIEKELNCFYDNKAYKDGKLSQCKECNCLIRKQRYNLHREEELIRSNNYCKNMKEKRKQRYEERKEAGITKQKSNEYYQKNKSKIYVNSSLNRKKRIKQATLPGYEKEIIEIYKNRPKGFHVDHIIPLQGENVSGLHVPWNLQIITAEENLSKGNKVV